MFMTAVAKHNIFNYQILELNCITSTNNLVWSFLRTYFIFFFFITVCSWRHRRIVFNSSNWCGDPIFFLKTVFSYRKLLFWPSKTAQHWTNKLLLPTLSFFSGGSIFYWIFSISCLINNIKKLTLIHIKHNSAL